MSDKKRYSELNVEKLNIVDQDDNLKMTLFNQNNIPPAIMDGKDILPGHRQEDPISGIMFYNSEGDECGGLIFGSEVDEEGNVESGMSFTIDQYKQDQVVQMHYTEEKGQSHYGFEIFDRPSTPLSKITEEMQEIEREDLPEAEKAKAINDLFQGAAPRASMSKTPDGEVGVKLMDSKGNQRIRMVVGDDDVPRMEFLNEKGEVTYKLPPEGN
ncbi:hypothetical protein [Halalkalibacillus halophilus]|uniref:hypothetical protein n=1 Tax=Halalkalibacillus halophilus TaxID=392827 RepID=UPI00040BDEE4|nr:hypothetical protein [Halalkalibacillus halophilus]